MVRAMNVRAARILVVDDERMIRWGLARALEEAGYQVDQAGGAKEALEIALREPTDASCSTSSCPTARASRCCAALRKHSPLLPVVMITAHASIEGAVEAVKEGAYDYLSKPFELDEVIQTVGARAGGRTLARRGAAPAQDRPARLRRAGNDRARARP
jgi:DNA-binding NtrC family response regulator